MESVYFEPVTGKILTELPAYRIHAAYRVNPKDGERLKEMWKPGKAKDGEVLEMARKLEAKHSRERTKKEEV